MQGWLRVAIAAGILGGGIFSLNHLSHGEAVQLRRTFNEFPLQLGSHRGVEQGLEPAVIKVLGVTDFMMRLYTSPDRPLVWLYVGYYSSQRTGVIIHSPKQCLPGSGWSIVKSEHVSMPMPGTPVGTITVNRVIVAKQKDRQLVLYWYQERGRVVASEYWGKAYMVWDSITRARTDGALVRISAPVVDQEEDSYRQLVEFSQRIFPLLTDYLPG
jgi:EpsI family protein